MTGYDHKAKIRGVDVVEYLVILHKALEMYICLSAGAGFNKCCKVFLLIFVNWCLDELVREIRRQVTCVRPLVLITVTLSRTVMTFCCQLN